MMRKKTLILWSCVLLLIPFFFGCHAIKPPDNKWQTDDEGNILVEFLFKAPPGAERVTVAGTFNGWNPETNPLTFNEERQIWTLTLPLKQGQYQYKFVVDGITWFHDPNNPNKTDDHHGGYNSVLSTNSKDYIMPIEETEAPSPPDPANWKGVTVIPESEFDQWEITPRDIYIWLPPSYRKFPDRRFSVLYMHNGQNIWDEPNCCYGHGGWYVNTLAEKLISEGKMREIIIIGIPNSHARLEEYSVGDNFFDDKSHTYCQFLTKTLKPYIDAHYRTLPDAKNTALMGSSMGGPPMASLRRNLFLYRLSSPGYIQCDSLPLNGVLT